MSHRVGHCPAHDLGISGRPVHLDFHGRHLSRNPDGLDVVAECAELIAHDMPRVILIGRRVERLQQVKARVEAARAQATISTEMSALKQADVIITVTSAVDTVIQPDHLKSGCVVCDVARPRDVAQSVVEQRDDVLVIEGGMVEVPGEADFHFNFGFPPRMAYACMAETIALALEGRYEDYTLGKDIKLEKVKEIAALAERHGFRLGGLRSFDCAVTQAQIDQVRQRAWRRRATH